MATGVLTKVAAKNIRQARLAAGLSQERLADLLGLDRSYISHLESGQRGITLDLLSKIAAVLGSPPEAFLSARARFGRDPTERGS